MPLSDTIEFVHTFKQCAQLAFGFDYGNRLMLKLRYRYNLIYHQCLQHQLLQYVFAVCSKVIKITHLASL